MAAFLGRWLSLWAAVGAQCGRLDSLEQMAGYALSDVNRYDWMSETL